MTRYRNLFSTFMLLVTAALLGAVALAAPEGPSTVTTAAGPVRGAMKSGVNTFLGIPVV